MENDDDGDENKEEKSRKKQYEYIKYFKINTRKMATTCDSSDEKKQQ